jgi:glycosyltransferase involved in cell wall biosynthesis
MQIIVVDARMILSSGIGRYIRATLAAIERAGADLVLLGNEPSIRKACPDLECEIVRLSVPIYDPREQFALAKAVPPCDVFFSPHMTTTRLPVRARARVLTVHDAYHLSELADFGLAKRAYSRFMYRSALAVSDRIIAVSEFTRAELCRCFPAYADKVRVVPNFVDTDFFHPVDELPRIARGGGDYALFVGNMKPHKNIGVAVEAVRRAKSGMKLAIVGAEAGFRNGLGKELQRYKAMDHVVFLGKVDDEELRRLYSHAACFVFPSLYEGFGYPPLEAMACGCPVVCSDIPALRETCGGAAVFCDPRSVGDFTQGITRSQEAGARRSAVVERGFERVRAFSKSRFEAGVVAALRGDAC